jgi:hypothetical protein
MASGDVKADKYYAVAGINGWRGRSVWGKNDSPSPKKKSVSCRYISLINVIY